MTTTILNKNTFTVLRILKTLLEEKNIIDIMDIDRTINKYCSLDSEEEEEAIKEKAINYLNSHYRRVEYHFNNDYVCYREYC